MYNEESIRDSVPRRMNHNKQANQQGGGITNKICRKKTEHRSAVINENNID
jgi:hypothetical protein